MADNALKKRNALSDLGQGVSRGFWADGIGGPVDMIATLANLGIAGGGYAGHKLGLLSQPPSLIENPVGGSEWIAAKMRSNGLLNDNPGSTADAYGRVAGGLMAPLTAAKAPQIANALQQAPAALQRGAYAVGEKGADMASNHLQRIGAKPAVMGYHGTMQPGFDDFSLDHFGKTDSGWLGKGVYMAESPADASNYAQVSGKPGGAVYRVDMDVKKPLVIDWHAPNRTELLDLRRSLGPSGFTDWLKQNGFDGVQFLGPKTALNAAGERDIQWMAPDPAQVKQVPFGR